MSFDILTVALATGGKINAEYAEMLSAARAILKNTDGRVWTAILGADSEEYAEGMMKMGADRVFTVQHDDFKHFHLEAAKSVLEKIIKEHKPAAVLMPANIYGRELGPALAARIDSGLLVDLVSIELGSEGRLEGDHPVYGGKLQARVAITGEGVQLASIRPGVYPKPAEDDARNGEVEKMEYTPYKGAAATVREVVRKDDRKDVSEATIIVAGGRGVKSKDGFDVLESMARILNGAVGASRAAVDEGWREHRDQVGQTGKNVAPQIYFACGISGAVQHMVGVSRAKCLVAINKDSDAPIMKMADYAIEGDLFEIVPALTEELEKALK